MKKTNNDLGLKRFNEINRYAKNLIIEQDEPAPPAGDPAMAAATAPEDPNAMPPDGAEEFPPMSGETEATPEDTEVDPAMTGEDDSTEEMDVTDLVNMVKSVKKQLDDSPKAEVGVTQKMDDVFSKLTDLEEKLSQMDNVIAKIDELGNKIQQMRPKTPVEKLEMRSLDSYPFDTKPTDFFADKQQEMQSSGKNEYVLTKNDVENYGRNQIAKSFNPSAEENDYNF